MPDDRLSGRTESVNPPEGRGEIPFVWVQDDTTGHRYDVAETAIGEGMTRVSGVELNWSGSARPPKYRTNTADDTPAATPEPEPTPPIPSSPPPIPSSRGGAK